MKSLLVILLFLVSVFLFTKCVNNATAADPRGRQYAGAASCRQCHQAIYDSAVLSMHFNTTAIAGSANIHGSFTPPGNTFTYLDGAQIKMEKRNNNSFQVMYIDGKEIDTHKFDVIFGGKHAQTFLYSKGNQFFELPLSYYSAANSWATSPGFPIQQPRFDRYVGTVCFECHSSHLETKIEIAGGDGTSEETVPGTLIYGIDCERCHGPAGKHVDYHLGHPEEKVAKFIVENHQLSRQQQSDACEVCHGGNSKAQLISRFKFMPGDTLANFFMQFVPNRNSSQFDVHGNQSQLLAQSKCFRRAAQMTCSTCHDPHVNASNNVSMYSQKCMSCHSEANHNFCPKAATLGESIKSNCIDCHMPMQSSRAISFQLSGQQERSSYMLRNHRIAVYADSLK